MATVDLGKITASVAVGTVTTGAAGSDASVTNSGTVQDAVLNFQIPQGAKGDTVILGNEEEYTLYNTIGQHTDGAMTQKAVTDNFVENQNSQEPYSDLDIADQNGNVLVRFMDGNIETKYFNSQNSPKVLDDDNSQDLDISDEDGNVLVRFKNGHIQTKNFNSENIDGFNVITGRYKNKRLSLLGDSISTYGDPSATNQNGTYCYSYYPNASCRYSRDGVDSIAFNVANTYWMKLISETGMVLGVNESYRGTLVSGTSNAFNLQTRINHLGLNGTPDVILVYGGTNDAGNSVAIGTFNTENPQNYTDAQIAELPVSTFADAYRAMLIRLMKTYPFAELIVILPTFTTSYYTITNLDLYVEVIKEACDFFGIKYIDARVSGINIYNKSSYLVDGIHPNAAGMDLLFKKIYRQIIFC